MGNITLEQIDLIMQRANVSYAEAKEALEQCGGDTVEALLLLEKANKVKPQNQSSGNNNDCSAGNRLIFCCYISIVGLVIALILGYKVEIKGTNTVADKINSTIDLMKK